MFIKCKRQTMERQKIWKCKPLVIVNACCECTNQKWRIIYLTTLGTVWKKRKRKQQQFDRRTLDCQSLTASWNGIVTITKKRKMKNEKKKCPKRTTGYAMLTNGEWKRTQWKTKQKKITRTYTYERIKNENDGQMNGTISRRTNSTTVLHVSTYRACPISSPRTRARIEWCSYMATVYKCGKR